MWETSGSALRGALPRHSLAIEALEERQLLCTVMVPAGDIPATVYSNPGAQYCWHDTSGPYRLTGDVLVENPGGATSLSIGLNVRVTRANAAFEIAAGDGGHLVTAPFAEIRADLEYRAGSQGAVTQSVISHGTLTLREGTNAVVNQSLFLGQAPVLVAPTLVDRLADSTFSTEATIGVLAGNVGNNENWPFGGGTTIRLTGDVHLAAGVQLVIANGLEIESDQGSLQISGQLVAHNIQLDAEIHFLPGGSGSITNSQILSGPIAVEFDPSNVAFPPPTIQSNTFHTTRGLQTTADFTTPLLTSNNTFPAGMTLGILPVEVNNAAVSGPIVWADDPQITSYHLLGNVGIDRRTLELQSGVVVTGEPDSGLVISSQFRGGGIQAQGADLSRDLFLNPGAVGLILGSSLHDLTMTIHSGAGVNFVANQLAGTNVRAVGAPNAFIDLRNQYWGTVDQQEIEDRILHNADTPNRPTVLFTPFSFCSETVLGGDVTTTSYGSGQSVCWNDTGTPYRLTDDLHLTNGGQLWIGPGVNVISASADDDLFVAGGGSLHVANSRLNVDVTFASGSSGSIDNSLIDQVTLTVHDGALPSFAANDFTSATPLAAHTDFFSSLPGANHLFQAPDSEFHILGGIVAAPALLPTVGPVSISR